jgi:hypothetical protein
VLEPDGVPIWQRSDKEQMAMLKSMFPNLFSGKLGLIKDFTAKLDIDESVRPVRQPQRPIAFHYREAVEKEILRQVEEGILEKVDENSGPTPWVANLVIIPKDKGLRNAKAGVSRLKPDGQAYELAVRLTYDAKAQNKAIRRTRYPGKTLEDIIYLINGGKVFSKLDIIKAFHQMGLDEASRYLTTIRTHIGLFRYKRLHMGISCASEIFTEAIRVILKDCPCQLNMTDDILVHGVGYEDHWRNLVKVLKTLEEHGITLNLEKCQFFKKDLTFYGLNVSENGVAPTEDRCRVLREAKPPANAKELRSLLGVAQYSSRFMRDMCMITEPLWRLTKKGEVWKWTAVEQLALEKLKEAISTKCMAFFNKDWHTKLIVDVSPVGVGSVLVQVNPNDRNDRCVIRFASKMLTDIERRYSQCEKEAYAAVWGCERNWLYLMAKSSPWSPITWRFSSFLATRLNDRLLESRDGRFGYLSLISTLSIVLELRTSLTTSRGSLVQM